MDRDFGYDNLFRVIIGTDILQRCRFVYNDPPEWFTLEVLNAGQARSGSAPGPGESGGIPLISEPSP